MKLLRMIVFVVLSASSLLLAKLPVPRPAGPLSVTNPAGTTISLANYKGDVVLIQFLYTTCPHCADTAKVYEKLQQELGPRGLKVMGVAFNDGVQARPEVIRAFAEKSGVLFPIGVAAQPTVLGYLGLPIMTRFVVPQIVIVDRNGMVRAQSEPLGSPELQNEQQLRVLLEGLLKEKRTAAK